MLPHRVRVVIADDHPLILTGIKHSLETSNIEILNTAHNSTELLRILDQADVEVLVTDYSMPGGDHGDGLPLLSLLLRRYPQIRIVVMTMMDNPGLLRKLIAAGIRCLVSKSDNATHLVPAIQAARGSGQFLSPAIQAILGVGEQAQVQDGNDVNLSNREQEVLRLYATGMTVNDIAAQLHRSKQTISSQKNSAMRKIGVDNDAELFKYLIEVGLTAQPSAQRP